MSTPVVIVTAALTVAILLAASLVIAAGTRGDGVASPVIGNAAGAIVPAPPAAPRSMAFE